MISGLFLAFSFLTTIPMPQRPYEARLWNAAGWWFPLVAAVIGMLLIGVGWFLAQLVPATVTAIAVVALWAKLTGRLHLDGVADCFDGLWTSSSAQKRLAIMQEPQIGSFGAIGLIIFLIAKVFVVGSIVVGENWFALLLAPVLARWIILPLTRVQNARPGGLGDDFGSNLRPLTIWATALAPLALVAWQYEPGIAAVLLTTVATFYFVRTAIRQLGGITGDVHGLVIEMTELMTLIAFTINFNQLYYLFNF